MVHVLEARERRRRQRWLGGRLLRLLSDPRPLPRIGFGALLSGVAAATRARAVALLEVFTQGPEAKLAAAAQGAPDIAAKRDRGADLLGKGGFLVRRYEFSDTVQKQQAS